MAKIMLNKQKGSNGVRKFSGKKIGILGYGEIGQAIAEFYQDHRLRKFFVGQVKIKDLNRDDGLNGAEILHICIPWSENFIKIVKKEIKKNKTKIDDNSLNGCARSNRKNRRNGCS